MLCCLQLCYKIVQWTTVQQSCVEDSFVLQFCANFTCALQCCAITSCAVELCEDSCPLQCCEIYTCALQCCVVYSCAVNLCGELLFSRSVQYTVVHCNLMQSIHVQWNLVKCTVVPYGCAVNNFAKELCGGQLFTALWWNLYMCNAMLCGLQLCRTVVRWTAVQQSLQCCAIYTCAMQCFAAEVCNRQLCTSIFWNLYMCNAMLLSLQLCHIVLWWTAVQQSCVADSCAL